METKKQRSNCSLIVIFLLCLIFWIVAFKSCQGQYTNIKHLDSIIGYKYAVIDTISNDTVNVKSYYCEWNWQHEPEKLFIWEMNTRKHYRALGKKDEYTCKSYLFYEPIRR